MAREERVTPLPVRGFPCEILNLSADGKQFACASRLESILRVWNVDTGKELLADSGHSRKPDIELSADGGPTRLIGPRIGRLLFNPTAAPRGESCIRNSFVYCRS